MKKYLLKFFTLMVYVISVESNLGAQGTWTPLKNLAPDYNGGTMIVLTDGTIMCMTETVWSGPWEDTWDVLTPDSTGSYTNGTWSRLPTPMIYGRFYFGTQVLPDGNVYVGGGEYSTGSATIEVYNTTTKTWGLANGISNRWIMSDGGSELLYDGTVLQGWLFNNNIIYYPSTNTGDSITPCYGLHEETSWTKLPDGSIMNIDWSTENTERYIPQYKKWVVDATMPIDIFDSSKEETGPGFLLPNGQLFYLGGEVYTAYYTPTGDTNMGTWTKGPAMPYRPLTGQMGCPDASAAMMPNGKILCDFSLTHDYHRPAFFYEFDYLTNTFTQVGAPAGGDSLYVPTYWTVMLDLPDGSVLFGYQGSEQYYIYKPSGSPLATGKPTIDNIVPDCPGFMITGKLFNGITEGAAYGDDWQMVSNYPIVRLTNGARTWYARTTNWNRPGAVMTDSLEDTAYFTIPTMPTGTYSVVLVANGNPSNRVLLTVPCVTTDISLNKSRKVIV